MRRYDKFDGAYDACHVACVIAIDGPSGAEKDRRSHGRVRLDYRHVDTGAISRGGVAREAARLDLTDGMPWRMSRGAARGRRSRGRRRHDVTNAIRTQTWTPRRRVRHPQVRTLVDRRGMGIGRIVMEATSVPSFPRDVKIIRRVARRARRAADPAHAAGREAAWPWQALDARDRPTARGRSRR